MRRKITVLTLLLLHFLVIKSTPLHLFTNLTVQKGLNSNESNSIIQDKYGFIWIGTEEGIARYDGYRITKFKYNGTPTTIPSNNISCLLYDNEQIWIGTWNGLAKIDIQTFEIKQINIGHSKTVRALFKDSKGKVWIGTENGILVYDEQQNSYLYYNRQNSDISHNTIRAFSETKDGSIWIGTYDGLNRFKNNEFKSFQLKGDRKPLISNNLVLTIENSSTNDSIIWVGTETGLVSFNIYNYKSIDYNLDNIKLSNEVTKCIYQQNDSLLWLGTDFGLNILNLNNNQVSTHFHDPLQNHTIASNVIWEIFEDNKKRIWFITSGGVSFINSATPTYVMHEIFYSTNQPRAGNQVKSMLTDRYGNLWMATIHGVIKKNIKTGKEKYFTTTSPINERILLDNVYALAKDNYDQIWIGTAGGINIWNEEKQVMKSITANKENGLTSNYISGFAIMDDNTVWVSAWEGGLFKIVGDTKKLENLKFLEIDKSDQGKFLTDGKRLFVDNREEFWEIDTKNLQKQNIIEVEKIIEKKPITSHLYSKDGTIWLGIENSFIKYIPDKGIDKIIELENPTSSKIINITEGENSNIIATTYNSIIKISDDTQITIPINTDTYFKGFYNNSSTVYDNKTIFFGGDNGYVEIDIENIKKKNEISDIYISAFYINNQLQSPLDESNIFDKEINFLNNIELKYNQNAISADLTTLDYFSPQTSQYKYRLLPSENNWNDATGERNIAVYSNIKPGKYKLEIKGKSLNGDWSDTKEIPINIRPHILLSNLFLILYIVIIIALIYLVFNIFKYRYKLKNEVEIIKLQSENDKKIYESKINFFTNISHEFRTPLTLILPPIKQILDELKDPSQKNILQLAYKNSLRLSRLVNQLLDLRKIESADIKLNLSTFNLNTLCLDVYNSFSDVANRNEINYQINLPKKDITIEADREKLEIILFNLLSNAFKFTNFGGKIELNIIFENKLIVTVEDSGIGISSDEIDKIFNQFYQSSNNGKIHKTGSGIGLTLTKQYIELHKGEITVESAPNEGTRFIIDLSATVSNKTTKIDRKREQYQIIDSISTDKLEGINKKTILVVDDNQDILDYIKWNLQHKYKIITSTNGKEALEKTHKMHPSLIISDITMPIMDGIELSIKIKEEKTTAHIPIILLTAKAFEEHKIEGIKSGASIYITKPFDIDYLDSCINSIFEREEELIKFIRKQLILTPTKKDIVDEDEQFLSKVILIIENNISNPKLTVEFIANKIHISSTHLYRKVKEISGLSPSEIIINYRLKKAAALLKGGELNVTETVYAVGFSSISSFSKSFKNKYGVTPGKFK